MRTVQQIIGWGVMLILVFLILSRAAEANSIVNTLGGFASAETRNLQGYGPGGSLNASPATNALTGRTGFQDPGWGGGVRQASYGGGGLNLGSFNLASLFGGGGAGSATQDQIDFLNTGYFGA